MKKRILKISLFFMINIVIIANSESDFKIVAYFPLYSTVEEANSIDFSQFTHVNIEAIYSTKEGKLELPSWSGNGKKEKELIDSIISKGHAAKIKVLLTVGYSASTLEMIKDSTAREIFTDTLIEYCKQKNIDGIDLDLEGNFDSDGYTQLALLLRSKIKNENIILSAAVTGSPNYNGDKWTDEFIHTMDYINVMIYDIRGSWNGSPIGNHSSFEDFILAAREWNKRLSKKRIVLGTPMYGRTFADDGTMRIWGSNSWSSNTILYKDIIKFFSGTLLTDTTAGEFNHTISDLKLSDEKLTLFNSSVCENWSNTPYLTGNEMLGKTFYSGPFLTKEKTKYALENHFGGMMILKLSYDSNDSTSLIKTICNEIKSYQTDILTNSNYKNNGYTISLLNDFVINVPFNDIKTAKAFTLNGQLILKVSLNNLSKPLFMKKAFPSKGIFIVKLESLSGQIYTNKIKI